MKKGLQRLLENEEGDTYYKPPIPAASHCYLDSRSLWWYGLGVTVKEKSLRVLLSGTKFWSIAGLQSTC